MRAVAMRSPLVLPAFAWAMAGTWPHATRTEQASMQMELEARAAQSADQSAEFTTDMAAIEVLEATALTRAPALSVALFTDESEQLYPVQLHVTVRRIGDADAPPLLEGEVQAVDGQTITLDEVVTTPRGERVFRVEAVARHHIGDVIELDWELEVHEAGFAGLDWEGYLKHRFNLGPRPEVEAPRLALARADIIEVANAPFTQNFSLGDEDFELVLEASGAGG